MRFPRLLCAVVLVLLVACNNAPGTGYVTQKQFDPAHWEGGYETYYLPEYKCDSQYDYNSNSYRQVCGVENVAHQRYEEHHTWEPDRWQLKLENCYSDKKGKCKRGWLTVPETTFDRYDEGDHYPNPR